MSTRRDFLKFGGGAAALSIMTACQPQPSATESVKQESP